MAQMKLFGKDIKAYDDIDVDDLLSQLTEEQLEELGNELIDPDDSCIPPAERCRYKTDKKPSGPFNRKALLDYLEKRAREEKDWDEPKPFKKETRGKKWEPKALERTQVNDDIEVDTEWDEVLTGATEEELVDLAAILGFHGMLNQVQYHEAFVENKQILGGGGFQGVAKHEDLKVFDEQPVNNTDVGASLNQVKDNDPKLKELNLNNIKNISIERLIEFAEAIEKNTNLEKFHLANTKATDKVAQTFAKSLKTNKTLTVLNLESNYISGPVVVDMLEAININKTLIEFRIANQRPVVLGNKVEMSIAHLIRDNLTMLKFGIFMETPARVMVEHYIKRNNDNVRRGRVGETLIEAPPPIDNKYTLGFIKKKTENELAEIAANKKPEPEKQKEVEDEDEDEDEDDDEDETESSEEE